MQLKLTIKDNGNFSTETCLSSRAKRKEIKAEKLHYNYRSSKYFLTKFLNLDKVVV